MRKRKFNIPDDVKTFLFGILIVAFLSGLLFLSALLQGYGN